MLTKSSRKDPVQKVPEDGPFLDDTAPDPGSDPTVEHGGSWTYDPSQSASDDPYNTITVTERTAFSRAPTRRRCCLAPPRLRDTAPEGC